MRALLALCVPALLPPMAHAAREVGYPDVRPVFVKHCVGCHGPAKQRGGLRLDRAHFLREGGSSGPAVAAGRSGDSLVVKAVLGQAGVKVMPPKGPRLSAAEVALVRGWIDAGAKGPAGEAVVRTTRSTHWSFQPVVRPAEPAVANAGWPRNGIDRFVLARLEKEGIAPSPEAVPATLLRRVSLDLTGLPPSPAEVRAFVNDRSPGAYERVVDRLLASPHYGERWGRHWLDLARYADSNGYSIDAPRSIWKYRDWVVAALNADLPFDRFTVEQLAGDLLPGATAEQKVATGFHRNTQVNEEGGIDREQFRVEAVIDRTNTTGSVFLGLTVGCAQCHDHKFDPLSQKEYYQLYAFFNSADDVRMPLASPEVSRRRGEALAEVARVENRLLLLDGLGGAKLEKWEGSLDVESRRSLPKRIQGILAVAVNGRTPAQEQTLRDAFRRADQTRHVAGALAGPFAALAQLGALRERQRLARLAAAKKKAVPPLTTTLVVRERKTPRTTHVQLAGDFLRKGAVVRPGVPRVLPPLAGDGRLVATRLDLARWLVGGKNPLTGRVLVNRVWQRYFGAGLVETENDFGTQGVRPSHPALLDWLADEAVRRGWRLKELHRLVVTSATYRQSSNARPDLRARDPRNRLLARQNRLRLEAEGVRDVALAASGLLNRTVGGPGVFPPQPAGVYGLTQVPKNWVADVGPGRYRRGMYTFFWRSAPHPGLTVFDAPDATAACTRRNRSNTPLQALTLLNDQGFLECARALAGRVLREGKDDDGRIARAFALCLGRPPSAKERAIVAGLLRRQRAAMAESPAEARGLAQAGAADVAERAAWVQVGRVLLNLDETITRE
jgi:mono/diheme cytochrome c family protein